MIFSLYLQPQLSHGVIGNTADFGSVILGSSPDGSTENKDNALIFSALSLF